MCPCECGGSRIESMDSTPEPTLSRHEQKLWKLRGARPDANPCEARSVRSGRPRAYVTRLGEVDRSVAGGARCYLMSPSNRALRVGILLGDNLVEERIFRDLSPI